MIFNYIKIKEKKRLIDVLTATTFITASYTGKSVCCLDLRLGLGFRTSSFS